MRSLLLSLLLLCGSVAYAADPPLPPEAQKVLDDLEQAVAKLRAKAAADLQKVVDKETKAGHLEPALAVKKAADGLKAKADVGGKNALASLVFGVDGKNIVVVKDSRIKPVTFPECNFTVSKVDDDPSVVAMNNYLQFSLKPEVRKFIAGHPCKIVVRSSADCVLQYDTELNPYLPCPEKSVSNDGSVIVSEFAIPKASFGGRENADGDFRFVVSNGCKVYSLEIVKSE